MKMRRLSWRINLRKYIGRFGWTYIQHIIFYCQPWICVTAFFFKVGHKLPAITLIRSNFGSWRVDGSRVSCQDNYFEIKLGFFQQGLQVNQIVISNGFYRNSFRFFTIIPQFWFISFHFCIWAAKHTVVIRSFWIVTIWRSTKSGTQLPHTQVISFTLIAKILLNFSNVLINVTPGF